jgi:poly(3-hydroxybutyrate) depolymerase
MYRTWKACTLGAYKIHHYEVLNAGHCWYPKLPNSRVNTDYASREINASDVLADFFEVN